MRSGGPGNRLPNLHGHLPALDGLRGLAILMVIVFHFVSRLEPSAPADRALRALTAFGWSGVDLFFVLSGFLITGILVNTRDSPDYLRSFYGRRVLRIFPLYFAFLAGYLLLLPLLLPGNAEVDELWSKQGWYWTYTSNVLIALGGWKATPLYTTATWSLAIEEQFYLIWPVVVWLVPTKRLAWVCVGLIVTAVALRWHFVAVVEDWPPAQTLTATRMDALLIGALIALWIRQPRSGDLVVRWSGLVGFLAGAALILIIVRSGGDASNRSRLMILIGYTVVAVLYGAVLVRVLISAPGTGWGLIGHSRALQFLGKYSYGIYLYHNPVRLLLDYYDVTPATFTAWDLPGVVAALLFLTLGASLSIGVALLSWHFFEEPILRLKRYFPYRSAQTNSTTE